MADKPTYLTAAEAARLLRINPKKIYVLASKGEVPATRLGGKWLFRRELLEECLDGHTRRPANMRLLDLLDSVIIIQGSDDWLLDRALQALRTDLPVDWVAARVGSRAGLEALNRSRAHLACFHLPDPQPLLAALQPVQRIELFSREQGLLIPKDRRRRIRSLRDAVRHRLRVAMRQPGSGTHALLERRVRAEGLQMTDLRPVGPFHSHLETALAVAQGRADCGIGIRVAAELCNLSFEPLERERFCLAVPGAHFSHPHLATFLEQLLDWFTSQHGATPGYSFTDTGKLVA